MGKPKHFQAALSYFLQNMILQIVCSDSSDPSTFQCMCGRPVVQGPAVAVLYSVVSLHCFEIVVPSGQSSASERRSCRGLNLVSKVDDLHFRCCFIQFHVEFNFKKLAHSTLPFHSVTEKYTYIVDHLIQN